MPQFTDNHSILLVEEKQPRTSILKKTLCESNYQVLRHVDFNSNIVAEINDVTPDILILSTEVLPSYVLKQLGEVSEIAPLPIIIFSEADSPAMIKDVIKVGVSAFIVHEILPQRLPSIISVARARFKEMQSLRNELKQAKTQLQGRKYIDRAKGLIMYQKKISEDEAYKQLRKMAMDQSTSLADVAKNIIDVCELLAHQ
jgi:response regulator NasT